MEWLVSTLETLGLAEWFISVIRGQRGSGKVRILDILHSIDHIEHPSTQLAFKKYVQKILRRRRRATRPNTASLSSRRPGAS
jgi:ABC-type lipoprotein export system ATPase subunit